MAVLAATGWPDLHISATNCNFVIIPRNQFISGRAKLFSAKVGPMAVLSTRSRSNGWPDLSYPARSVYQRPGQPSLSKRKPNGRFINARPNGRFIKAEATGWPDLQISATKLSRTISLSAKLFSAKAGPMAVLSTRGPMAVLSRQKQPDGQTSRFQRQTAISLLSRAINLSAAGPSYSQQKQAKWPFYQREAEATDGQTSIIPPDQFISGRANLVSAKGSPMAVLSTRGPMAVLSRQKQPDGQTSRFQRQISFSLLSRTINSSAAGPSYFQQKQARLPFYQREAQWPFYQSRSSRMARPPDFNDKLHFRYYPARSVYQRPGQAILSKSRPSGRVINARPNCRFIKSSDRIARHQI